MLCPGLVKTRLIEAARNRPLALQNDPDLEAHRQVMYGAKQHEMRDAMRSGVSPDDFARLVFDAVRNEKLHVFTPPWVKDAIELRWRNILGDREPCVGLDYKAPTI